MKIVDANVLLYAVNSDAAQHLRVRHWWEGALNDHDRIGLPWTVVLAFLRLSTNARIFARPLAPRAATAQVGGWLQRGNVGLVRERDDHWDRLRVLLEDSGTAGNLTMDAHLAALALTHDAILVSCDTDFARFARLRWENPLA
ncbi:MAG: type II toxin-antitoxin system VapC family toxin [Rudaea sp.]